MPVLSEKNLEEYSQTALRLEVRVREIFLGCRGIAFSKFCLGSFFLWFLRCTEAQISIRNRFLDIDSLRKIWQQHADWITLRRAQSEAGQGRVSSGRKVMRVWTREMTRNSKKMRIHTVTQRKPHECWWADWIEGTQAATLGDLGNWHNLGKGKVSFSFRIFSNFNTVPSNNPEVKLLL